MKAWLSPASSLTRRGAHAQRVPLAALALGALLWSGAAAAQGPAAAPGHSERLGYEVTYAGGRVATVSLATGCPTATYVSAAMIAASEGLAQQLHPLSTRFDTFLPPGGGPPLQGRTRIVEQGQARSFITTFGPTGRAHVRAQRGDAPATEREHTLAGGPPHDLLSWMFALRQGAALRAGATYHFTVWDGWKLTRLSAKVAPAPTSLITPHRAGAHPAWKLTLKRARLRDDATPTGAAEPIGALWLDAQDRTPLGLDFKTPIGEAKVRLATRRRQRCEARD